MAELVVELYGQHLGHLSGTWRSFDVVATREAIERFGIDSHVLSLSVPLAVVPVRGGKAHRQNFFRELLPEGQMLHHLSSVAKVPAHDVIGILRRFGRDVAGALQIWDPEMPGEPREPELEPVEASEIAEMLRETSRFPLGNSSRGGKTSLAGVQDKIVLAKNGRTWSRVLDGHPSTHILKPVAKDHPTMIFDEEYGARCARALGLSQFATWVEEFDTVPALVIERYDRAEASPTGRIHQEDLNQALGVGGDAKYQRHGGRMTLGRIASAVRAHTDDHDLTRLLQMVVLSAAIGNLDLHAKNLSLLHPADGSVSLAPAYDVVPLAHHPNDGELALSVGGVYRHADVTAEHLVEEGSEWGLTGVQEIVTTTLDAIIEVAGSEVPHPRAHHGLADEIARFAENLRQGRPAGAR